METRSRPRPPPQTSTPFTVTLPPVPQNGQAGKRGDHYKHPNAPIIERQQTWFERILHMLLSYLSAIIACWLQKSLREWCLPEGIVLKIVKDSWDEEFEREKATYEYPRPLQGVTIPRYYGCSDYEGKKALVLSNIGGASLATLEGAVLDEKDLRELVTEALVALSSRGVAYDDTKLDNFHLVTDNGRDKIMIFDLEIVDQNLSEDDLAFTTES
ncbi:hypothetical protein FAVG1_11309 [Fusarium avenaceum]|nr:hypothetical protein FAVG1_11309 [Fusarium avenaceum]